MVTYKEGNAWFNLYFTVPWPVHQPLHLGFTMIYNFSNPGTIRMAMMYVAPVYSRVNVENNISPIKS